MSDGARSGSKKIIDPATGQPPVNPETGKRLVGIALNQWKMKRKIADLEAQIAENGGRDNAPAAAAPISEFLTVDCTTDCLAHITRDVQAVAIVSTFTGITIRRGERDMMPPLRRLQMKSTESRRWDANPFSVGHRILGPDSDGDQRAYDTFIKAQKSKWWHHRISKARASAIWQHPQMERPVETALLPEQFKGFDDLVWQAVGDLQPIEEFVPLREAVRIILMRLEDTFMDWSMRSPGHEFNPLAPNPYRNYIRGLPKIPQMPEKARQRMAREESA